MFIGRDEELRELRAFLRKKKGSLIVCRGRRRIGKSTLIQEFGKGAKQFIQFQGLAPTLAMKNEDQLDAFSDQLTAQTNLPRLKLESWPQAFRLLENAVQKMPAVILLDEISWMGRYDTNFPGHLKVAWDSLFASKQVVLVLCGSISSWIEENILNNTGFVGRCSWDLVLGELPLKFCNHFWNKRRNAISSFEKLKILAVTGGVPRYLEEIDPSLEAEANIARMCLKKESLLFREFDSIFLSIFDRRADTYKRIVESLDDGAKTLTEICDSSSGKILKSGRLSEQLNHLVLAGFISRDQVFSLATGKPTSLLKYRLSDNYMRFYLKYIKPIAHRTNARPQKAFELQMIPNWEGILGLQFENLVLNNLSQVMSILSLNDYISAAPYVQTATKRRKGCQIDCLIHTKNSFYLIETKFKQKIGYSVIDDVRAKISRLKLPQKASVRTVLIYEGALSQHLQQNDFFDCIIPFEQLLNES